ncbi:MAG TPA: EAL domain-containing protein [Candidatus Polarisedimenticolia bacterium]|jgi:EAL domain-containing protein (putative c-di-GMP-specific phosphodiesterase class I)
MSRRGGMIAGMGFGGDGPSQDWDATDPGSLVDEVTALPTVPLVLDHMRLQMERQGYLSVLSINVLQNSAIEQVTGWKAFDSIVRDVGRFLASIKMIHLRREDFVSEVMISGNAFVILLAPPRGKPEMQVEDIRRVRDRLHGKLKRFLSRRLPPEISERFTCYIGASLVRNDPAMRTERLVYRALDDAQADSLAERDRAARRHLMSLREVLASRLVRAVYQPVVDIENRKVLGWEALSRPLGEQFENIDQLFKAAYEAQSVWTLERLCRERAMEGLPVMKNDELLFLNVEPDSIYDPQFRSDETLELLKQASLSPDRVVLEMTEHSAVRDFTAFRQTLTYFRSLGFRLAIDDMGSGYSGLISVAEIQPEFVKIDMSLIRDLHSRPLKRELVDTITRFSRRAGIQVVAEGIETIEELNVLRQIGVHHAQGYLFARPAAPPPEPDLSPLMCDPGPSLRD